MQTIKCPKCQSGYKVAQSHLGRQVVCKNCGTGFQLGQPDTSPLHDLPPVQMTTGASPSGMTNLDPLLQRNLRSTGVFLTIFGIGVFLLPMFGVDWKFLQQLGNGRWAIGLLGMLLGGGLLLVSHLDRILIGLVSGLSVVVVGIVLYYFNAIGLQQQTAESEDPTATIQPASQSPLRKDEQQTSTPDDQIENEPGTTRPKKKVAPRPISESQAKSRSKADTQAKSPPQATSQRITNLISGINLDRDVAKGTWSKKDGALISPTTDAARIIIAERPPQNYELTVEAERLKGTDSLNVGLVVAGRETMIVFEGYKARKLTGINRLDGRTADWNQSTYRQRVFKQGKNLIQIRVVNNRIQAIVNGKSVIDWQGNPLRLSFDQRFGRYGKQQLVIGSWGTSWRISRYELREL